MIPCGSCFVFETLALRVDVLPHTLEGNFHSDAKWFAYRSAVMDVHRSFCIDVGRACAMDIRGHGQC